MDAEGYYQDARTAQKANDWTRAASLWEKFFLFPEGERVHQSDAFSNYMFCLAILGKKEETVLFTENYFKSVRWFDIPANQAPKLEVEIAEANADLVIASLQSFGCCLIRGHYDVALIDHIYAKTLDLKKEESKLLHQHLEIQKIGELVTQFLHEIMTRGGFQTFPENGSSWIRTVTPRQIDTAVPFHQDLKAFSRRCINVWTPLTHAGGQAPGLELLPVFVDGLVKANGKSRSHYAMHGLEIAEEDLDEAFPGAELWHPVMEPGDALLFLSSTIHRTYITSSMRRARRSLELRFASL